MILLLLLLTLNSPQEATWTIYNAEAGQTDETPLITADGSLIDLNKLNKGEIKWVAVSIDLKSKYPFGTKIIVSDCKYNGVWEVHDVMNERFTNKIDFLVPSNIKLGKGKCTITKLK